MGIEKKVNQDFFRNKNNWNKVINELKKEEEGIVIALGNENKIREMKERLNHSMTNYNVFSLVKNKNRVKNMGSFFKEYFLNITRKRLIKDHSNGKMSHAELLEICNKNPNFYLLGFSLKKEIKNYLLQLNKYLKKEEYQGVFN